ncbi:unnamed protein product, partial [Allacma fusca]
VSLVGFKTQAKQFNADNQGVCLQLDRGRPQLHRTNHLFSQFIPSIQFSS